MTTLCHFLDDHLLVMILLWNAPEHFCVAMPVACILLLIDYLRLRSQFWGLFVGSLSLSSIRAFVLAMHFVFVF